jgi:hypothetical protein
MVTSATQEGISSSSRIIASSNSDSSPIEDQGHVSPPILIPEERSLILNNHKNGDSTNKSEEKDRSLNNFVKKTDESVVQNSVSDSLTTAKISKKKAKSNISTVNLSTTQDSSKALNVSNGMDNIASSTISHEEIYSMGDITSV